MRLRHCRRDCDEESHCSYRVSSRPCWGDCDRDDGSPAARSGRHLWQLQLLIAENADEEDHHRYCLGAGSHGRDCDRDDGSPAACSGRRLWRLRLLIRVFRLPRSLQKNAGRDRTGRAAHHRPAQRLRRRRADPRKPPAVVGLALQELVRYGSGAATRHGPMQCSRGRPARPALSVGDGTPRSGRGSAAHGASCSAFSRSIRSSSPAGTKWSGSSWLTSSTRKLLRTKRTVRTWRGRSEVSALRRSSIWPSDARTSARRGREAMNPSTQSATTTNPMTHCRRVITALPSGVLLAA
jgi:hypothetical protein